MVKHAVILADPPWRYDFEASGSREIENQYPTMELDEIKKMNIETEDDAVLFLWATAPKLIEALEVMKAWGFTYKTHLIWDKEIIGMGYWFRGQHELLLVGTKGNFSPPDETMRVSSVIRSRRREHSRKPDVIRTLISKWYPNSTKIEIFARQHFEGWDVYGNEVPTGVQKTLCQQN
jgi:N6-adenosine-specific RNA methylase IME4